MLQLHSNLDFLCESHQRRPQHYQHNPGLMADWLHCNTCLTQPGQNDGRHYFLTSCGHIFCEKCQDKGWKEKCQLCHTPKPAVQKLSSNLPPPVDAYFSDPMKKIKKICSDMKKFIATLNFQNSQKKHLITNLQKCVSNQEMIVQQHDQELKSKISTHFEQMQKENQKLREAVIELKKMVGDSNLSHLRENTKLKEENSYLKKLLSDKRHSPLRSPSGDRIRSPAQRGYGTPTQHHQMPRVTSTSNLVGARSAQIQHSPMMMSPQVEGRVRVSPAQKYASKGTPSPYQQLPRVSSTSGHLGLNKSTGNKDSPVTSGKKGVKSPLSSTDVTARERKLTPNGSACLEPSKSAIQGTSFVTPGRISVRTPPSGGKMGTIPNTPQTRYTPFVSHPKSAPHPVFI